MARSSGRCRRARRSRAASMFPRCASPPISARTRSSRRCEMSVFSLPEGARALRPVDRAGQRRGHAARARRGLRHARARRRAREAARARDDAPAAPSACWMPRRWRRSPTRSPIPSRGSVACARAARSSSPIRSRSRPAPAPRSATRGPPVPGMPVESFIQTGDRKVISYLMKPLSDQVMRAFRER